MNRILVAVSLSLSVAAIGIAAATLLDSRAAIPLPDVDAQSDNDDLRNRVEALQRELEDLSSKYEDLSRRLGRGKKRAKVAKTPHRTTSHSVPLDDTVAALTERLNALESAETIHRLAQSGREQVASKRLATAFDELRDPDTSAEKRIEAMRNLRNMRKTHRREIAETLAENELKEIDLAWPMIEIAQDFGLDAELRGEALRSLAGMKTPELRQPLTEILSTDPSPEVRTGAFDSLVWHMEDATVREIIRVAAGNAQDPAVQSRATRILPKVDYLDRRDAEAQSSPGTTAEK